VTHGGKPLYYFAGDAKPGDTNGQGVGVWYAVTPDGELVKAKATGAGYPWWGGVRPLGMADEGLSPTRRWRGQPGGILGRRGIRGKPP
jgi:hypothetical protein